MKDVPDGDLFGGTPAKFLRDRKQEGLHGDDPDHIWLHEGAFQGK